MTRSKEANDTTVEDAAALTWLSYGQLKADSGQPHKQGEESCLAASRYYAEEV